MCVLSTDHQNSVQKWTIPHSLAVIIPISLLMGGIEAALIIALRAARDKHLEWSLTIMAVLSAALLAAGVLRHYWDIYVHRTVRGISFLFVGIDAAGDVFSLVSVLFQEKLDVLGLVIYGTELVLWIGVFAAGGYYNFVPWVRKRLDRRGNGEGVHSSSGDPVAMHDLPSSTSVFRTPSGEIEAVRHRARASRRKGQFGGAGSDA
jgi:hypothetical protein